MTGVQNKTADELLPLMIKHFIEMTDLELDKIMSYAEAGKFCNCDPKTLRKYKLEIGGFNRGGKVLGFRKRNLIEWIARNEEKKAERRKG